MINHTPLQNLFLKLSINAGTVGEIISIIDIPYLKITPLPLRYRFSQYPISRFAEPPFLPSQHRRLGY